MCDDGRDGHGQACRRGHQGLRDAPGHDLGIAGTGHGNGVEGRDHAQNGAEEAEQGSDIADGVEDHQMASQIDLTGLVCLQDQFFFEIA